MLTKKLAVAFVAGGLLVASPAEAKTHKQDTKVKATVALGAKKPAVNAKAKPSASKRSVKAKVAQVPVCTNTDVMPTPQNVELVRAAILCLHNQTRVQAGLPALKSNAKLQKAATGHSNDMVVDGYFDHTTPAGDTFVDRIIRSGYVKPSDGYALGENLAWGTGDLSTAQGVVSAWMNSAGHKANILKKAYREVGIGINFGVPTDNGVGATITCDFGTKL